MTNQSRHHQNTSSRASPYIFTVSKNSGEQKEVQVSSVEQNKKSKPSTKRPRVQNNNNTNSEGLLFTNLTPSDYRKPNTNNTNIVKKKTKSKAAASNVSQSSQQKIAPKPRVPILKIISRNSTTDNPPPPPNISTDSKAPTLVPVSLKIITTQTQQNNDEFSQNLTSSSRVSVQENQPIQETQEINPQPSQAYSNATELVLSTNQPNQNTSNSQDQNNIPQSFDNTLESVILTESPSINDFNSQQTYASRKLQISDIIDMPENFSSILNLNESKTKVDVHGTGSPRVVIEAPPNENNSESSSNIAHGMTPTTIEDDGNHMEIILPTVMIENSSNKPNDDNDATSTTGNLKSNQGDNTPLRISTPENDMNLSTLIQVNNNNNHHVHLHRSPRDSIFGDSSSELSTVQTFSDSSQNNSPINFRSPFSQIHDDSSLSLNLDDVSSLSPNFDDESSSSSSQFYEDPFVSSPFPNTLVSELNNNPSALLMEDNGFTSSPKSAEAHDNRFKSPQSLQDDALLQPENELTSTFATSLTLSLPNSPKDNLSSSPSHDDNCTCEKCTTESDDIENMDFLEKPIPECLMDDAELEQVREPRVDLPPNANELSDAEAMPYIVALCKRYWLYRTLAMLIRLGHVKLNDEELNRIREVKADLEGPQISESLQEVFRKEIHERMIVERARLERAKLWTEEDILEVDGPDDNYELEVGPGSDSEMDDEYEDAVSSTYFEGQETMLSRQGMILKENVMSPSSDNKSSNSF
ncbi:8203_t:CDS:2 [Ambispora gerdemannii]|uniref:8203_t:CDS:1 n=1 Tax=Ambispora gerdemannii TaxID=144530 RepID=A0A9N9FMP4_9GLOM|nr:8203_t:CDS:2 [Ambispora gerdemannii]